MGFRLRKSVNLGGGARLNLSKSGVGASVGTKGFRVGAGPSGSRANVSVPGTGIGYEIRSGKGRRRSAQVQQVAPPPAPRRRGFFGTFFWLLKWAIIIVIVLAVIAAVL
jgi:hypothetical protein